MRVCQFAIIVGPSDTVYMLKKVSRSSGFLRILTPYASPQNFVVLYIWQPNCRTEGNNIIRRIYCSIPHILICNLRFTVETLNIFHNSRWSVKVWGCVCVCVWERERERDRERGREVSESCLAVARWWRRRRTWSDYRPMYWSEHLLLLLLCYCAVSLSLAQTSTTSPSPHRHRFHQVTTIPQLRIVEVISFINRLQKLRVMAA